MVIKGKDEIRYRLCSTINETDLDEMRYLDLVCTTMQWAIKGSCSSSQSRIHIHTTETQHNQKPSLILKPLNSISYVTVRCYRCNQKVQLAGQYLEARWRAAAVEQFISCSACKMKSMSSTLASRGCGL